jgi:hypothetical protein
MSIAKDNLRKAIYAGFERKMLGEEKEHTVHNADTSIKYHKQLKQLEHELDQVRTASRQHKERKEFLEQHCDRQDDQIERLKERLRVKHDSSELYQTIRDLERHNKVLQKADKYREKIWKKRVKDLETQLSEGRVLNLRRLQDVRNRDRDIVQLEAEKRMFEKQLLVEAAKRRQLEQACLQCGSRDLSWLPGLSEPVCGGCALEDKIQELEQQL